MDNNKVTSDIVYINTLAHSATAAIEEAAGKDYDLGALDETITAHVDMATALPVSYFNKKNCQTFSEKFTGKKHHVCVYIGDKEVMVELIYDFVKVIPEGVTLQDEGHKYHATAVEFIMPALENQAEEILHKAKQVIQQANNEIDVVCVYGGGSIMMREALEKKLKDFCDRAMIKLLYMPKKYAVTLEVSGLNVFLNSKVFAALKEASAANN